MPLTRCRGSGLCSRRPPGFHWRRPSGSFYRSGPLVPLRLGGKAELDPVTALGTGREFQPASPGRSLRVDWVRTVIATEDVAEKLLPSPVPIVQLRLH